MMDARNFMLCATPNSDRAALVPWPDYAGASDEYEYTLLACSEAFRSLGFEGRKKMIFIEAMHLIVGDGVDPQALHKALLGLPEYRDALAPDMPGAKGD